MSSEQKTALQLEHSFEASLHPLGAYSQRKSVDLSRPISLMTEADSSQPSIKRCHVMFLNTGGRIYVRAMTGRAALLVNGEAVREASLQHGDVLKMGVIQYQLSAPALTEAANHTTEFSVGAIGGGQAVTSQAPVMIIGSGEWADVRLSEASVADAHAAIFKSGDRYWIRDLGTEPGVRVNGRVERFVQFDAQSVLEIGTAQLRLVETEVRSAPRETAPPVVRLDKERLRNWGPLARAVAVAYEPGLEPELAPAKPRRRGLRVLIIVVAILIVLSLAAYFGWPYLKPYYNTIFKGG